MVADNMGHKVSHPMTITLSDEGTVEREVAPSGFSESLWALPVLFRAVLGVSLLLNLFLGLALFRHRAGEAGLGMRFCIRRSGTVISRQGIGLIERGGPGGKGLRFCLGGKEKREGACRGALLFSFCKRGRESLR